MMKIHSYTFALAAAASVLACGDDGSGEDVEVDASPEDSTADDAGTVSDANAARDSSVVDSAVGADAAAAMDAGAGDAGQDGGFYAAADSGPRDAAIDSGTAIDSAAPIDSSVESDSGSQVDSGTVPGMPTSCEQCERSTCQSPLVAPLDPVSGSYQLVDLTELCADLEGTAAEGPAAGTSKSQLCSELVACGRETGCGFPQPMRCVCGDLPFDQCQETAESASVFELPGACLEEVLAAGETVQGRRVFESYIDPTTALGAAFTLLECSAAYCSDECWGAPCAGQADGTTCFWARGVQAEVGSTCLNQSCTDYSLGYEILCPPESSSCLPDID